MQDSTASYIVKSKSCFFFSVIFLQVWSLGFLLVTFIYPFIFNVLGSQSILKLTTINLFPVWFSFPHLILGFLVTWYQSMVPNSFIPLCSAQWQRLFNTTRLPGEGQGKWTGRPWETSPSHIWLWETSARWISSMGSLLGFLVHIFSVAFYDFRTYP